MNKISIIIVGVLLAFLSSVPPARSEQIKNRYVTLIYADNDLLRSFDNNVYLGDNLGRMMPHTVTVQGEVLAKLSLITEKAESILNMFPNNMHYTVILEPNAEAVDKVFYQLFQKDVDYIAFYGLDQKTIYISVNDANLQVIAHEIGHAVVDHYFKVRPPYNIHELMAQFVAAHISD